MLQRAHATCAPIEEDTPVLLLAGRATWGRTGNRLRSLLYALQHARDHGGRVGILYNSWAMRVLLDFFFARGNDGKGTNKLRTLFRNYNVREGRGKAARASPTAMTRGPWSG